MSSVRDFIYMDIERIKSIIAQLERGFTDSFQLTEGENSKVDADVKASLAGFISGKVGANFLWQSSETETRTLHDFIYSKAEDVLIKNGQLLQVPNDVNAEQILSRNFDNSMSNTAYALIKGYVNLNDFRQMKDLVKSFNDIGKFLAYCGSLSLPDDIKGKDKISHTKSAESGMSLDKKMRDGLVLMIDSFYKDRIVIKSQPYDKNKSIKFVGNLKPDSLREDIGSIVFKYGTAPNSPWTIFCQIASIPEKDEGVLVEDDICENSTMENSFQRMFDSLRNLESTMKPIAYPEIAVTPIAIYRS